MGKAIFLVLLLFPCAVWGQHNQLDKIKNLIAQGNCDESTKLINQSVEKKEFSNQLYYYKAICEQENELFENSILSATNALKLTSDKDTLYPYILLLRSSSYGYIGNIDFAIRDAELLVQKFPNKTSFLLNLSYLYGEKGEFNDCIQTLNKAKQLDSTNVYIFVNLAYYSCESGDFHTAEEYANRGLTLTKDSIWIGSLLNSLGYAQSKLISADQGIETIKKAIGYNPNSPYPYFNIGRIYFSNDKRQEACSYFLKAKQLGGSNMTKEYLKKLNCE